MLDPSNGLNRYKTAPRPQICAAYSSSTANFISAPAMAELERQMRTLPHDFGSSHSAYEHGLEALRGRLRCTWNLPQTVSIVFAASGTDLEYVGLATASREHTAGIDNILLGVNEVGSGCIYSACGKHFAGQTPLGREVEPGAPIAESLAQTVRLVDIPIRSEDGQPLPSKEIMLLVAGACEAAILAARHPLVHVVHGSKTGIIAPSITHIDELLHRFGDQISFVVDACQARINGEAIKAYLARGCTVFLTGSKFMGGPPFSGFALVPGAVVEKSLGVLPGFEKIFARADWPLGWPGRDALPARPNLGLLLRLEASVFELERYNRLQPREVARTIHIFEQAADVLGKQIGAIRLDPQSEADSDAGQCLPLEMRTLVTLDLSASNPGLDYDVARKLYDSVCRSDSISGVTDLLPVRVGQPTKSARFHDGRYRANLRLGLSMPLMVKFSGMSDETVWRHLNDDFGYIGNHIEKSLRAILS